MAGRRPEQRGRRRLPTEVPTATELPTATEGYIGAMLLIASMKTRCCGFEKLPHARTQSGAADRSVKTRPPVRRGQAQSKQENRTNEATQTNSQKPTATVPFAPTSGAGARSWSVQRTRSRRVRNRECAPSSRAVLLACCHARAWRDSTLIRGRVHHVRAVDSPGTQMHTRIHKTQAGKSARHAPRPRECAARARARLGADEESVIEDHWGSTCRRCFRAVPGACPTRGAQGQTAPRT